MPGDWAACGFKLQLAFLCSFGVLSAWGRWSFLELATNEKYNDSLQAYAAGLAEAAVSEQVNDGARQGKSRPLELF